MVDGTGGEAKVNGVEYGQTYPIDQITVGERSRATYEGIEELAESMANVLLQPIGVDQNGRLLFGGRRLRAAVSLGWDEIAATVFTIDGELTAVEIEQIENAHRRDLTPEEKKAEQERINALIDAEIQADPEASANETARRVEEKTGEKTDHRRVIRRRKQMVEDGTIKDSETTTDAKGKTQQRRKPRRSAKEIAERREEPRHTDSPGDSQGDSGSAKDSESTLSMDNVSGDSVESKESIPLLEALQAALAILPNARDLVGAPASRLEIDAAEQIKARAADILAAMRPPTHQSSDEIVRAPAGRTPNHEGEQVKVQRPVNTMDKDWPSRS